LDSEATKTPAIKLFAIIHDEKTKEEHASDQFFSSLLEVLHGNSGKRLNPFQGELQL
jgi:hypothetical protein